MNLLKYFLFILFLVFPHPAQAKSVTIVMYDIVPYVSPTLANDGFVAEIITTAFKRAGYDVSAELSSWPRCLSHMENGTKDVMTNLFFTKERAELYGYPETHLAFFKYVFYKKDGRTDIPDIITLSDLKKLKVGLVSKASYSVKFDAVIPELTNVYYGLREILMLQMLLADRLDIVPSSFYLGEYFKTQEDKSVVNKVKQIDSDFFEEKKLFPIFNKKNPDYLKLMADYDLQMKEMKADKTLETIYLRHNVPYFEGK